MDRNLIAKLLTIFNISILVIVIYLNFYISNKCHEINVAQKIVDANIEKETQLLSTLNAEFTYLTSPKYLKILAKKYLTLCPIASAQIIKDLESIKFNDNSVKVE